jgi:arabinogalactan oligomer/maltooligosaccharide transport system permease protein
VFTLLAALAGERRGLLLTVALLLFAGALFGYGFYAQRAIAADVRASEDLLAARVGQQAARAQEALRGIAVAGQPLDLSRWDVDLYGLPRGLIGAGATVNQARLQARLASAAGWVKQSMLGVALPGLLLLLLVGLGGAQRLGATLRKHREAYAYTLPALLGMLVLVFFPFLYGIALSFTDSNIYNSNKPISEIWVGLRNFIEILGDFNVAQRTAEGLVFNFQNFYWTLGFTIVWTISNVAIGVSVGLLLALILNTKGLKLRAAYRVLLILPWAVPNYITALTWKGMFHPQFGVVNQVIQMFGGGPIGWSDKTSTAFITILATNGWLSFPFMMVISLGALQSIPADLYEAATVDGASRWRQFRSITLPSLKPALIPAIILSVIWTFNMFNIPYLVSGGEPGHSTEILITQAYKFAFEQYRYGYAAAYSTVIFVILLIYGTWQNRVTRATEGL